MKRARSGSAPSCAAAPDVTMRTRITTSDRARSTTKTERMTGGIQHHSQTVGLTVFRLMR